MTSNDSLSDDFRIPRSFDPDSLSHLSPYDRAMVLYRDWPVDESLGRPAGQTTDAIREFIRSFNGFAPGAELAQQHVTPDRMTAGGMIHFGREYGLSEADLESIYEVVAELELFRDNPSGDHPLPLAAYPPGVVQEKLEELKASLRT